MASTIYVLTETMGAPSDPDTPFALMKLPTELRLKVLHFALTDGSSTSTIQIEHKSYDPLRLGPSRRHFARPQINLLLVCRQVEEEATPILYGSNCFRFIEGPASKRFLRMIGKKHANLLQHCEIDQSMVCPEALKELTACTKLKTLDLYILAGGHADYGIKAMSTLSPLYHALSLRHGYVDAGAQVVNIRPTSMCFQRYIDPQTQEVSEFQHEGGFVIGCLRCQETAIRYEETKRRLDALWAVMRNKLAWYAGWQML